MLVFQALSFWHVGTCSKGNHGRRRVHRVEASSGLLWPEWNCATPQDMLETLFVLESKAAKRCATMGVANVFSFLPLAAERRPQFAFTWNWLPWGGSTKFSAFTIPFSSPGPGGWEQAAVVLSCPPRLTPTRCVSTGASPALCFQNSPSPPSCWANSDSSVNTEGFPQENVVVKLQKQTEALCLFWADDSLANILYSSLV